MKEELTNLVLAYLFANIAALFVVLIIVGVVLAVKGTKKNERK